MSAILPFKFVYRVLSPPWNDPAPVRQELFGIERLEQHAASLAAAQAVTTRPPVVLSLRTRLNDNARVLLAGYRASAADLESGRSVVPAAEWVLDNYHLIEAQIREIRDDLPRGYYRQLPKLAGGPFAGYPRVFGIAWAYIAHTDSHFDPEILRRFVAAYQRVQPLTIGELWAIAITLRVVLVENLRRLVDQLIAERRPRADADALASRLLAHGAAQSALDLDIATRSSGTLSQTFAAQLAKRLRDQDPRTTPALGWLEDRLHLQGSSVEGVVQEIQRRQGASNVTVRNVITSMRLISDIDWAELFESVSLVDDRLGSASGFASMDFATRNLYRDAIEQLARGSSSTELEIAELALTESRRAVTTATGGPDAERVTDPGYHLIAQGRPAFERRLGFRPPFRLLTSRFIIRLGIGGYGSAIVVTTLVLLALALWTLGALGVAAGWLVLLAMVGFAPASEVAIALVNRAVTLPAGASTLPGLDLTAGVPPSLRTLVAVPTLLTGEADLLRQIEQLEVHHLAGVGGELTFALLLDGVDADREVLDGEDVLLRIGAEAIDELNRRHGPGPCGDRFLLLHRRRVFNATEDRWMGWERKRGKLHELNRLLRGAGDTTFITVAGRRPWVPPNVRYVITLDADTRLPRDAASRLIGKMAHPLNSPAFDPSTQRIIRGHAILQPRVTPSLPIAGEGSTFQRAYSAPGGIDPYAAAVSDIYQDLFDEGSYTGKGIYDVDSLEAALAGRVPENTMLSHDLFEGVFARAGLASDIEVMEEFPSRYDVAGKRLHRWTRGDWQLLPWIFGRVTGPGAVPAIGRWKMLDNLRRSLLAPNLVLALGLCWLLPIPPAVVGTLLVLGAIAAPALLPLAFSIMPHRPEIRVRNHIAALGADFGLAVTQTALSTAFLADQAWRMADAIIRTLVRLFWSHRHLLEWTTAAEDIAGRRLDTAGFYRVMAGGTALGLVISAGSVILSPSSWPVILPFGLLWLAAPVIALRTSRKPSAARQLTVPASDSRDLRLIARRTWRFFETFVTPSDNMLPPDNFQEAPRPAVAHRTSPTNIGLYLLSAVAARDFGWAGTLETVARLEATFSTLQRMQRHNGHFFNWYGTEDLRTLDPPYVSSVDSGNLAGHLIALANACEEWIGSPLVPDPRQGIADTRWLAGEAFRALPGADGERGRQLRTLFDEIDDQLKATQSLESLAPSVTRLTEKAARVVRDTFSPVGDEAAHDTLFWLEALERTVGEHAKDHLLTGHELHHLNRRLTAIADMARAMAMAMDFKFLLDPERKLLSIGYSLAENSLDPSCYDLLASEAQLASFFAIAKGDAPTRHWFRLGRTATPVGNGSALISWSGSMFEYLMPSLVMGAPAGSLLEQTNRLVVERQESYGRSRGLPWGVSESAYNARDMEFTYQYSNFGIPGLGLKRGLSDDLVIAPYATGLAAMVHPRRARENYAHLAKMGADGRYGFYEALDFTRLRVPEGQSVAIVRNYMAHHQGMTIVALMNALQEGRMRRRFHREPMVRASELLLQERVPRDVAIAHPRAEEVKASAAAAEAVAVAPTVRRLTGAVGGRPTTHILSNGRYVVMLTATAAGYSRWRDIAVTRWREDATRDDWGSFVFLKDMESGKFWSPGAARKPGDAEDDEVIFEEDHTHFIHRDGTLTTTMDVLVSGEDDAEVRRVSLINRGRRPREIELTSYAELVLTTPAADNAHPAFAKMFVETEHLPEFGALIATRRRRSSGEPEIWAAHFAVVEGEIVAEPQFESDRAHFLGRGRALDAASAVFEGLPLSNTVGTVLDPVFSLRRRVAVPPGKAARVAFWTIVAATRAELLELIDKHHDRSAFDRAKTLAWTQAQVQLRYLDVDAAEAADFQRLTAPILYADNRFRPASEVIIRGAGPQSGLWPHAISGDLPIVLLRIDEIEDIGQVRQLLRAHEYWRIKRLGVDVVILNERASSYIQDLQVAIETAVRSSQSRPRFGEEHTQGSVYVLRSDLMTADARTLLRSVARLALTAHRGSIADQLDLIPPSIPFAAPVPAGRLPGPAPQPAPVPNELEFFNGLGGFDKNGREYVTIQAAGKRTPAPWINVIANPAFGFQVSADGSGYTWAENSRENQLTPWSNDPVSDPAGEAIYVRDEDTLDVWSPTSQPIRDAGTYVSRHGFGYSVFEHEARGIALNLLQYVPLGDPIKISRLKLRNTSRHTRRLSVTAFSEWVLGTSREASGPFIITEVDASTGAILVRNPWNAVFSNRVAFADLSGRQTAWTADRTEFFGHKGGPGSPAALRGRTPLSGRTGAGLDPCTALQATFTLRAGETIEIVSFLGQCASAEEASALISRYRAADLDAVLKEVADHWENLLSAVQVKTPDRAMDIMLNGWLLYQTLACRIWARSAFYQASGAYGFRDQLQDGMALAFALPEETRRHLLRAAARQFVEGDVQHWWLPNSGRGVRTRISDDRVWLAFATASYVATTGDSAVLDEVVPFLEGQILHPEEHDAFFQPMLADSSASLFDHCARGLDQSIGLTGERGLPLMGTGDWNDGMNRVGEGGKGESVWLGWLLVRTIALFAPLADSRDPERAGRWRAHAELVRQALEGQAWDGEWYRRATFDDGTWLGSRKSEECQIDSIAQSWAVLSGAADPKRAATAMTSLDNRLIRRDDGLALLFTPPFDKTQRDPGYIKGYPPGLRENGGQYSHAAMWAILAFAELGAGDKAAGLFSLVNPINHASTPEQVARYKVEPYVVAADIYSVAPHVGRGGWTWYTGSAAWMYRAGIEGILGIRREGTFLVVTPRIPQDWPAFEASVKVASTRYEIRVQSVSHQLEGASDAILDDAHIECLNGGVRVPLDGAVHRLVLSLSRGILPASNNGRT